MHLIFGSTEEFFIPWSCQKRSDIKSLKHNCMFHLNLSKSNIKIDHDWNVQNNLVSRISEISPTQKDTALCILMIFMYKQEKFLRFAKTLSSWIFIFVTNHYFSSFIKFIYYFIIPVIGNRKKNYEGKLIDRG